MTDVKGSTVVGGCWCWATCSAPSASGIGVLTNNLCGNEHLWQFTEILATIQGTARNEELVRNKKHWLKYRAKCIHSIESCMMCWALLNLTLLSFVTLLKYWLLGLGKVVCLLSSSAGRKKPHKFQLFPIASLLEITALHLCNKKDFEWMSAPLKIPDREHRRGCFLQELDWKRKKTSASCLFVLLGAKGTASKGSWLSCSESPHLHMRRSTWEGDLSPWGRVLRFVWGAMRVPSAVPFLWKARQCVSAHCLPSLGKQKHLNMRCKQSNIPWFRLDLQNHGLVWKLQTSLVS